MLRSEQTTDSRLRIDAKLLAVCTILLAAAAGGLILTRPAHRIAGDFMQREDIGVADAWLLEQLENPIAEQRARAYLALARIEGPAAVERLTAALGDAAPSVRAQAAFGIGHALDARGAHARRSFAAAERGLVGILHDDDRRAAARAVEALGKIQAAETAPLITQTAAPIVVTMTALIRMGAVEQAGFIAEYLESDDQDSRWAAALAVAELGLEWSPPIDGRVLKLLRDPNEFVRAAALRAAAAATPAQELIEAVAANAQHGDSKVRYEAEQALAALAGEARPRLPAGEPRLRARAAVQAPRALYAGGDYQSIAKTLGATLLMETSSGDFEVELDYENAPLTAEYFRRQAGAGALDGCRFATAAPNGYIVADARLGCIRSEINSQPFLRGSLGLLRMGGVSSPGEFFFCLTSLPLADSRYVNFGRLASGDKLLDRIAAGTVVRSIRQIR